MTDESLLHSWDVEGDTVSSTNTWERNGGLGCTNPSGSVSYKNIIQLARTKFFALRACGLSIGGTALAPGPRASTSCADIALFPNVDF